MLKSLPVLEKSKHFFKFINKIISTRRRGWGKGKLAMTGSRAGIWRQRKGAGAGSSNWWGWKRGHY